MPTQPHKLAEVIAVDNMKGMIAAGDLQTAEAGATILRQGGNAVDAAVAATFASFMAEMVMVNIGGGGVATVHIASTGQNLAYDFFSDMPSGQYNPASSDFRRVLVNFGAAQQPFYIGRASVAVPGAVAGLCQLAADYGSMPLADLLAPTIKLCQEGAVFSKAMSFISRILRDIFVDTPGSAALYEPQNRPVRPGERVFNPHLAHSLHLLAAQGANYFYRGELAQAIIADQAQYGGVLTAKDLAQYKVKVDPPLVVSYRGYDILLPPLSSLGGVLTAFTLRLLSKISLNGVKPNSNFHLRVVAEAMRLTNVARRDLVLTPEGVQHFLSYNHLRLYQKALLNILDGVTPPLEPRFKRGSNDTSHLSVIDAEGNIVSVTTSAGEGAGFTVGESGIFLNNMLGEADLHPNGFHQTQPGVRLQTMMTPTLVLHNNKPVLALGSGGSTRIRSAIIQVIVNVIDFDMSLREAVDAPRIHFEEDILHLEGGFSQAMARRLSQAGYNVNLWPERNTYFGGVHSVQFRRGAYEAVGDHRRGGVGLIVV
jgi:gamma-glutamyltranspeptidase/glutathione hydrolase